MKRTMCIGLLLGGLLMITAPLLAQQQAGDTELQLQGSLIISTKSGSSNDSGSVVVDVGRFFTDHQEVGFNAFGTFIASGEFAGAAGPFYRFNFGTGKVVPYVGASINASFVTGGGSSSGGTASAEGGVRWFLARNSAFSVSGTYTYDLKAHMFQDQFQILFGFSHFWKR